MILEKTKAEPKGINIYSKLGRQRRKIDEFDILYKFDICVFNIVKIDNKRP